MNITTYSTEETVRVWARNLTNVDTGPVTEGATMTVQVATPHGTVISTGTGQVSGETDDWYCDMDMPSSAGMYDIHVTVSVGNANYRERTRVYVEPAPVIE